MGRKWANKRATVGQITEEVHAGFDQNNQDITICSMVN